MGKPLTSTRIIEDLQNVLHDLHDLSAMAHREFKGVVVVVPLQYRDFGGSTWKVTLEPYNGEYEDVGEGDTQPQQGDIEVSEVPATDTPPMSAEPLPTE